jgi:hypothetical protein
MIHYDVQLIGGMVLHEGKIAEMQTGEGKNISNFAILKCVNRERSTFSNGMIIWLNVIVRGKRLYLNFTV